MNNTLVTNVFWRFAERMLAQIVSFVVSIVLARLLLPDAYGAIAMVSVFISIADVFVTGSFSSALIQKKDADDTDFSSVFYFSLAFSLVLYLILFFSAPAISSFYETPILAPVIRVMALRLIIASLNSVQHAYVSKRMIFKKYFWSTLFGTVLSGVMGILFAYAGFGVWALVTQYMTNTVVDTVVLWFTVKWRPKLLFSWKRLKELLKYGWKILFEGLSETISKQLRSLLIGKVYSSVDLGYYSKAQQFPSLLINNVNTAVSSVLFPAMSIEQDDAAKVKDLLRKSVSVMSYVLFPMLTGLAIVARPLVTVLLTDKWLDCVPYLQIFCFTYGATIGMLPRHQALNATGRSDVYMYEHMVSRIIGLIWLFSVYKISVFAVVISEVASTVIFIFIIMYTSKRYNNYKYTEQISDVLSTMIFCAVMGVPVYFILYLNLSPIVTLCLQVLCGAAVYIALSVIFKPEGYKYVISCINRFLVKLKTKKGDLQQ